MAARIGPRTPHAVRVFSAWLDLFLPAPCIGCGQGSGPFCPTCAPPPGAVRVIRLAGSPRHRGWDLPRCAAAGDYAGSLRSAILAYKERRHHAWAIPLGGLLADAVTAAAGCAGPLRLVPVPSSATAVRARGVDHVRLLADGAADHLRRAGHTVAVSPVLTVARRIGDSVGLSAAERGANIAGAFRVSVWPRGPEPLVLVDDVFTTGATLGEAARTLTAAGLPVSAAAVVAATPRRG